MKKSLAFLLSLTLAFSLVWVVSSAQMKYKEAPMLAEMVKAGKLPPVEERLPKDVLVLKPHEEIGRYGGTIRRVMFGIADWLAWGKFASDPLVRWKTNLAGGVEPNVAKSWEWSQGGKVLTMHLREGIKWSDGAPFTADDILFQWEEVWFNKEIQENPPSVWVIGGEPANLEKLDDYTIRFTFPKPYPLAIRRLAYADKWWQPKHYLKQFHPKFNPAVKTYEELDKRTAWNSEITYPDQPTLWAWDIVEFKAGERLIAVRNPYYWKVDPEGNQLPYVDRVVFTVVENTEVATLKAIAGEIDMQFRHMKFANYTVLKENEERGGYRVDMLKDARGQSAIYLNWDCPKPELRELIRNKNFRVALSIGIDREEINETLFYGLLEPMGYAPLRGSEYFREDLFKRYSEYDPDRANKMLDELGMKDIDGDGFREAPNGKPITMVVDVTSGSTEKIDTLQLVTEQWRKIGIKAVVNAMKRDLFTPRTYQGKHDALIWTFGGASVPLLKPYRWFPGSGGESNWWSYSATQWYLSGGKEGEEPSPLHKRLRELYEKAVVEPDDAKRRELVIEAAEIHAENVLAIGILGPLPVIQVVKKNMGNVPKEAYTGDSLRGIATEHTEQFYFKY